MQAQLRSLIEGIQQQPARDTVGHVFADLTRLLGYLNLIEDALEKQDSLSEAIPIFTLLQGEAFVMLSFIESEAADAGKALAETLDSLAFAIKHELRRVFERELAGMSGRNSFISRVHIVNSHDMLRNCFQQSTVILARLFDPTIKDDSIFTDISVRRKNSLLLYEDLSSLIRITQHTATEYNEQAISLFVARLDDFHAGSMRYLMQKDWKTYEGFMNDFKAARNEEERKRFLERFASYLEVLLRHVRMRLTLGNG
jgi:hypothetical protein